MADATLGEVNSRRAIGRTPWTVLASRYAYPLTLGLAVFLGVVVRARFILASDFPLNDGGLFLVMSQAIADAHFRLPSFVTYNAIHIPFGYSPLAFYVAAAVNEATGMSLTDVLRYVPLVVTSATIVAFLYLARAVLKSRVAVVAAVFAFALVPRSFIWLLMGGGLTRSFGLLFTIMALHQAFLLFTRGRTLHVVLLGVFTALTVLSHLGTAPFLLFSAVLLFLAYGRTARALTGSIAAAILAVVLTAPWWGTVVAAHGFAPFAAAGASGSTVFSTDAATRYELFVKLARFGVTTTDEFYFPLVGTLAIIGALVSLTAAEFYLPAWWLVTLLLDVRAGATYAAIPASLLAGIAVAYVLLPLARGQIAGRITGAPVASVADRWWERLHRRLNQLLPVLIPVLLVCYGAAAALTLEPSRSTAAGLLVGLSPAERSAMRWVATSTPPASRYLVVTPQTWSASRTAEWFPVLANRTSVATVQGSEWLPNHAFARRIAVDSAVESCAFSTTRCLDRVRREDGLTFTHVFIGKSPEQPCCTALRASLRSDPSYQVIYDGPGATIAAVRPSGLAR
ncbi:MAG: hypothetical protein ACR2M1_15815 [Gemmatimonadaceae bacterium]